MQMSKGNY